MAESLSTAALPPQHRVAFWIDAVCGTLQHVDCTLRGDEPFFGEVTCDSIGALGVGTVASVAQSVVRSARQIERAPAELCFLAIQRRGRGYMAQDGRETVLGTGDLAFVDSNRPHELTFDGSFSQVVLKIPKQSMLQTLGGSERFTVVRIDGSAGIGALLSPLLQQLPRSLPEIPSSMHHRISENVLNLIASAFAPLDGEMSNSASQTLARVKLWVETHLGDDLSAEHIAGECRMSVRHLNRLFASDGTSLMAHVWERRLLRCHRDLTNPAMRGRSISEIAFAAGYKDLSHFSRAYRMRDGRSPREFARAAGMARCRVAFVAWCSSESQRVADIYLTGNSPAFPAHASPRSQGCLIPSRDGLYGRAT